MGDGHLARSCPLSTTPCSQYFSAITVWQLLKRQKLILPTSPLQTSGQGQREIEKVSIEGVSGQELLRRTGPSTSGQALSSVNSWDSRLPVVSFEKPPTCTLELVESASAAFLACNRV